MASVNNEEAKRIRDSIITIDETIQKYLYRLNPKTVEKWFDVKHNIDELVHDDIGKSVYGQWN